MPDRHEDKPLQQSREQAQTERKDLAGSSRAEQLLELEGRQQAAGDSTERDFGGLPPGMGNRSGQKDLNHSLPPSFLELGAESGLEQETPLTAEVWEANIDQDRVRTRGEAREVHNEVKALVPEEWRATQFVSERATALQEAENTLAALQGREALVVQKWPPDKSEFPGGSKDWEKAVSEAGAGWAGQHDHEEGWIRIHEDVLKQDSPLEAIRTLAHESRHEFQDTLIEELHQARDEGRAPNLRGVSHEKVREWDEAGPVPDPSKDLEGYSNHPREVDSRQYEERFADEFTRRLYEN